MKPIYKKVVLWILLVLHISLIFSFSMQNATETTDLSRGLTDKVKTSEQFAEELRNKKDADGNREFINEYTVGKLAEGKSLQLESIVRKLAHIILFFILGLLINLLIGSYGMKRLYCCIISPLFAMSVGFVDETIQLFSVGRAGSLSDVFIDLIGAVIASTFFFAGGKLYEKNKEKRLKMDS